MGIVPFIGLAGLAAIITLALLGLQDRRPSEYPTDEDGRTPGYW